MHDSIHGQLVALVVYIYYILLVSVTLIGVGRRGGYSSRLSLPRLAQSASAHNFILQVYINTLYICFFWLLVHVQYRHSLEGSYIEGPFGDQCI